MLPNASAAVACMCLAIGRPAHGPACCVPVGCLWSGSPALEQGPVVQDAPQRAERLHGAPLRAGLACLDAIILADVLVQPCPTFRTPPACIRGPLRQALQLSPAQLEAAGPAQAAETLRTWKLWLLLHHFRTQPFCTRPDSSTTSWPRLMSASMRAKSVHGIQVCRSSSQESTQASKRQSYEQEPIKAQGVQSTLFPWLLCGPAACGGGAAAGGGAGVLRANIVDRASLLLSATTF